MATGKDGDVTQELPIIFGPQVCGDLDAGGTREWLVADGLGGYAMGTVCGLRTRRYHALLVVADAANPAARRVGLVALDPVLTLPSGAQLRLGTHEWASGAVSPDGYRQLELFTLEDGLPRWRWRVGDLVIERELAMVHGAASLGVVHRLLSGSGSGSRTAGGVELSVEAVCTWRDAHGERWAAGGELGSTPAADGLVVENAYRLAGPGWQPAGEWYFGAYARQEAARGLTAVEDLWYAGRFSARLAPGEALEVSAWAGDLGTRPAPAGAVVAAARQRARRIVAAARPASAAAATLALAADAFVVRSGAGVRGGTDVHSGTEVVAGYPWFGAWSRDTMIAYEGLLLETGRADEGRALLRRYAATLSEGMLANTADSGSTEYNTVDGTLWFVHAVERHVSRTQDTDLAAELLGALDSVLSAHLAGTRYGIRVDPADGLLTQGADGYALTWMDARVDGVPVTPRAGKPVEVNALWVNGLAALAALHARLGRDTDRLDRLHARARESFAGRYPTRAGGLHDVVDPPGVQPVGLRPNQLLAWSLPYAPLDPDRGALARIGAALLTPLGLRSLAPQAPGYAGRHAGGSAQRDRAYHQGTVWPWLLGPYVDVAARLAAADGTATADETASTGETATAGTRDKVRWRTATANLLAGIDAHLAEWGLGSVSETADGDAPHHATGCPFQAWSVAEVLRIHRKID